MAQENVVIKFDAETTQALAALQRVAKGFENVGDSASKAQTKATGGIDGITQGLLKFQGSLFAVEKAFQAVGKAMEFAGFSAQIDKLEKQVSGRLVESVQRATNGVVSQMDIMKEAAKATAGGFKLTEQQIVDVWAASKNLADKGLGTVTENADKMFKSLRKGSAEELKEFGIVVKDGSTKAQAMDQALRQINATAQDTSGLDAQADAVRRTAVTFSEVGDYLKRTIGAAILEVIKGIQFLAQEFDNLVNRAIGYQKGGNASRRGGLAAAIKVADEAKARFGGGGMWTQQYVMDIAEGRRSARTPEQGAFIKERYGALASGYEAAAGISPPSSPGLSQDQSQFFGEPDKAPRPSRPRRVSGPTSGASSSGDRVIDVVDWSPTSAQPGGISDLRAGSAKQSSIADLFPSSGGMSVPGAPGFMDSMRDAAGMGDARSELLSLQEMGTAVGQVTRDAIAGSISAAIAGQMSLAKATKMAVGQALAAQAQTWIVRGGMELLFGNPRGAAIVAGGVAALALARSLGGGSSGSGSAPGGTVPGGGFVPFGGPGLGGQLGPSGPSSVTFNLRGRDPRENAVIFDKAYRDAKRAGMIPDGDGPSRLVG